MAFPKGKPRPKNAGRKAGTPNKVTAAGREAFQLAFQGLGGVPHLIEWARDNETEFYKLFSKTIPLDITSNQKELAALTATWTFGDKEVKF